MYPALPASLLGQTHVHAPGFWNNAPFFYVAGLGYLLKQVRTLGFLAAKMCA